MLTNKHPELDRCPNLEKLILLAEYEKLIAHIDEENTVYTTKKQGVRGLKETHSARTLDTRVASSDANSFSSLLHLAAEKIDKISTQLTQEHAHYTDTKEGKDLCRNMSRITAKIKNKSRIGDTTETDPESVFKTICSLGGKSVKWHKIPIETIRDNVKEEENAFISQLAIIKELNQFNADVINVTYEAFKMLVQHRVNEIKKHINNPQTLNAIPVHLKRLRELFHNDNFMILTPLLASITRSLEKEFKKLLSSKASGRQSEDVHTNLGLVHIRKAEVVQPIIDLLNRAFSLTSE